MPYISTRVNCPVSPAEEKQIVSAMGQAITLLPGKREDWLMVEVAGDCHLYFRGKTDDKLAFITVKYLGSVSGECLEKLTAEATRVVSDALGIQKDNIYVQYEECTYWGWNGNNF